MNVSSSSIGLEEQRNKESRDEDVLVVRKDGTNGIFYIYDESFPG